MAKEKKPKKRMPVEDILLIRKQAKKELEKARDSIADEIAEFSILAVGITAYDICGLTGDDLKEFMEKFMLQFDCLAAGTVSLDDLKFILKNEAMCEFNGIKRGSVTNEH